NCATQCTGLQDRNREAGSIERGKAGRRAVLSSHSLFQGAARLDGNDRVVNAVIDAVKEAANCTGVINHAERLAALVNANPFKGPTIDETPLDGGGIRREFWQLVAEVKIENVGAIEVRCSIGIPQVERIVPVIEQSKPALFVRRVRPRIGEANLQTVTQAFLDVRLQRVVHRNARGFVAQRLRRIADVGNAHIDVAAFIRAEVIARRDRRLAGDARQAYGSGSGAVSLEGVAVTVVLPVDGMRRRSDLRLVEGHRNHQVTPQVADVADLNQEVVARLPLNVQGVVDGVGQLVLAVINRNGKKRKPSFYPRYCGQIIDDICRIARWRRLRLVPPRRR